MRSIAVIVDGVWQVPVTDGHHALVESRGDPVDAIVRHLGEVVWLAPSLSKQDHFVHAASSTLAATTSLPVNDQRIFEATLRDISKR